MGVEPEDGFVSDDELKSMLERWVAPGPSRVLDKRIETSFAREFSGADRLSQSVLLPHRREEVVSMKFCSVCEEEFADKFSFCPVDGTPLTLVSPNGNEPSVTVSKDPSLTISHEDKPRIEVPIGGHNGPIDSEPIYAAADGSAAMVLRDEYHLTMLDDAGLTSRLSHELRDVSRQYQLTWPEFKRDPFGFTKRTFVGYGQMLVKFMRKPNVLLALGAAVLCMLALVGAVVVMDRSQSTSSLTGWIISAVVGGGFLVVLFAVWLSNEKETTVSLDRGQGPRGGATPAIAGAVLAMVSSLAFVLLIVGLVVFMDYRNRQQQLLAQNENEELQVEQLLDIPDEQPTPDPGTAGLNKGSGGGSKPKPERAAGGGGGGREESKPASFGKVPQASLDIPQVVAPDPKPPQIKNPSLPVAATVVADPMLVPPDARVLPYGDYKSKSTDPSSGPGTGNGIGTGTGGGIGPGEGGGLGPGRGGNIGGGDRNDGGGGPGGGGGGDYSKIFTGREVTSKARLISKPEPQYTEDARKNQITGTVVLKVVFSSNGQVTNIRTVSGLPYGLTERAIAAARQIKFVPATKDGHQVSMWMQLEYNFNLY